MSTNSDLSERDLTEQLIRLGRTPSVSTLTRPEKLAAKSKINEPVKLME